MIRRGRATTDRVVVLTRASAQDKRLSYRARGVLLAVMSRPDDWRTDIDRLAGEGREGEHAVATALRELETFGYLRRSRVRGRDGRLRTEWVMTDDPALLPAVPKESTGLPTSTEPRKPRPGRPRPGAPRDGEPRAGNPRPLQEEETNERDTTPSPPGAEEFAAVVLVEARAVRINLTPGVVEDACRKLRAYGWTAETLREAFRDHGWHGARGGAVVTWLRELREAPAPSKTAHRWAIAWCGYCSDPTRRLRIDPDTGSVLPGQPCPDCTREEATP